MLQCCGACAAAVPVRDAVAEQALKAQDQLEDQHQRQVRPGGAFAATAAAQEPQVGTASRVRASARARAHTHTHMSYM